MVFITILSFTSLFINILLFILIIWSLSFLLFSQYFYNHHIQHTQSSTITTSSSGTHSQQEHYNAFHETTHTQVPIHIDFFAILIWSLNNNTSYFSLLRTSPQHPPFYGHTSYYTSTLSMSNKPSFLYSTFFSKGEGKRLV